MDKEVLAPTRIEFLPVAIIRRWECACWLWAAGGIACTGISGEDYAVPGRNALVLQTPDPREFVGLFERLKAHPTEAESIRRNRRKTAKHYAWREIIERLFLPRLDLLRYCAVVSIALTEWRATARTRSWS